MKIVILDGYAANPGDLSWDEIAALGELTVYDRTSPEDVVARAADADAVFVNKVVLDATVLKQLPHLRFVGVMATGYNNVDIAQAHRQGITICNVPAYSTESVAQTIFAHILNITNQVALHSTSVHRGGWLHCRDFCYRLTPIIELSGSKIGVYGLGNIGSRVARIAHAFGMEVMAVTSKSRSNLPEWITPVGKEAMLAECDVVVLCAQLTADNHHFIDADALTLMKPTAILINTARGGMVDSVALGNALKSKQIAAAGIDVLETEPPTPDNPLLTAPNCFITPHTAWQSDKARHRLLDTCAANLRHFIAGAPENVVE